MKFGLFVVASLASLGAAAPAAKRQGDPFAGLAALAQAFANGENAIQAAAEAFITKGEAAFASAFATFNAFETEAQTAFEAFGLSGEQTIEKAFSDFISDVNQVGEALEAEGLPEFAFGIGQLKQGAATLETAFQSALGAAAADLTQGLQDIETAITNFQNGFGSAVNGGTGRK